MALDNDPFGGNTATRRRRDPNRKALLREVRRRGFPSDRTECQISDGQDDGETRDPPPAR